jgi:hypothetical protein
VHKPCVIRCLRSRLSGLSVCFSLELSKRRSFAAFYTGHSHAALTFWGVAAVLVVIFGSAHGSNPEESHIRLFSDAAISLALSLSIWYTRSLWWAVCFHTAWNWGETFFYGTPTSGLLAQGNLVSIRVEGAAITSGGSAGAEGNIFVLPIVLLVGVAIYLTCRPRMSAVQP